MSKSIKTARAVGAVAVALLRAVCWGQEAGVGQQIKTEGVELKAPQAVLGRGRGVQLYQGIVMPQNTMSLNQQKPEQSVRIGDGTVTFRLMEAGKRVQLTDASGPRKLNIIQGKVGFQPEELNLGGGKSYRLAMPYAMVYEGGRMPDGTAVTMAFVGYRSGEARQFELGGQKFLLYDENTDGVYRKGDDSVTLGPADQPCNVMVPMGKMIATPEGVYEIASVEKDGSALKAKASGKATGAVLAEFSAPEMQAEIAWGERGGSVFFVTSPANSGVETKVLPGTYQIQQGLVYSDAMKRVVATVVLGDMRGIDVKAGEKKTVELGGPFVLSFQVKKTGEKIDIQPASLHLRGKAGEEYTNIKWKTEPQVIFRAGEKETVLGKMGFS